MSFERRKVRVGKVVSDKMDKTVVVAVEWSRPHRLYKKAVKRRARFKAHDEKNESKLGDVVRIIETRPRSKTKRWRIADILSREDIAEIQPEDITVDGIAAKAATPESVAPAQETTGAELARATEGEAVSEVAPEEAPLPDVEPPAETAPAADAPTAEREDEPVSEVAPEEAPLPDVEPPAETAPAPKAAGAQPAPGSDQEDDEDEESIR